MLRRKTRLACGLGCRVEDLGPEDEDSHGRGGGGGRDVLQGSRMFRVCSRSGASSSLVCAIAAQF